MFLFTHKFPRALTAFQAAVFCLTASLAAKGALIEKCRNGYEALRSHPLTWTQRHLERVFEGETNPVNRFRKARSAVLNSNWNADRKAAYFQALAKRISDDWSCEYTVAADGSHVFTGDAGAVMIIRKEDGAIFTTEMPWWQRPADYRKQAQGWYPDFDAPHLTKLRPMAPKMSP